MEDDTASLNSFKTCPSEPNLSAVPRQVADTYDSGRPGGLRAGSAAVMKRGNAYAADPPRSKSPGQPVLTRSRGKSPGSVSGSTGTGSVPSLLPQVAEVSEDGTGNESAGPPAGKRQRPIGAPTAGRSPSRPVSGSGNQISGLIRPAAEDQLQTVPVPHIRWKKTNE